MRNFRLRPLRPDERQKLFCLHCDSDRGAIGDMLAHLKMRHDITSPDAGVDYIAASGIERLLAEEDAAADHFHLSLESLVGADDFLLECGDA
jgi:hypothetical protein